MHALEWIAERRIAEALARGELDRLPGAGRPLALEEDPLVPEDRRVANRLLRNAGLLPPELEEARRAGGKLRLMQARVEGHYFGRVVARLGRRVRA